MISILINSIIKESRKIKNNQNNKQNNSNNQINQNKSSNQINSNNIRAQKAVIRKNLKTKGKSKKSCDKRREKREIFNSRNNHKIIKLNFNNHNHNSNNPNDLNNKLTIILSLKIVATTTTTNKRKLETKTTTKTSNKKSVFLIKTLPNTGIKKNSKQYQTLSKILFCPRFRIT